MIGMRRRPLPSFLERLCGWVTVLQDQLRQHVFDRFKFNWIYISRDYVWHADLDSSKQNVIQGMVQLPSNFAIVITRNGNNFIFCIFSLLEYSILCISIIINCLGKSTAIWLRKLKAMSLQSWFVENVLFEEWVELWQIKNCFRQYLSLTEFYTLLLVPLFATGVNLIPDTSIKYPLVNQWINIVKRNVMFVTVKCTIIRIFLISLILLNEILACRWRRPIILCLKSFPPTKAEHNLQYPRYQFEDRSRLLTATGAKAIL